MLSLGLAYTNAAGVNGTYTYALTERWSVGAVASAYSNRYEGVSSGSSFSDNHGYYAGGNAGYAFSDRTQLTATAGYAYYSSDISHSDSATATLGLVHQFSPGLTISASGGGFWSDTTATQGAFTGSARRATRRPVWRSDQLRLSPKIPRIVISLAENLAPSGAGVLSKSDKAGVSLSSRVLRSPYRSAGSELHPHDLPAGGNEFVQQQLLLRERSAFPTDWQSAGRWTRVTGIREPNTRRTPSEPTSNLAFLSIGYNWPGASFTGWVGQASGDAGIAGRGTPFASRELARDTRRATGARFARTFAVRPIHRFREVGS